MYSTVPNPPKRMDRNRRKLILYTTPLLIITTLLLVSSSDSLSLSDNLPEGFNAGASTVKEGAKEGIRKAGEWVYGKVWGSSPALNDEKSKAGEWDEMLQDAILGSPILDDSTSGISETSSFETEEAISDPSQRFSTHPLPRPQPASSNRKYLSYLPHSGFHNQRIELSNALSLASYLNRTLLLPPIWVGAGAPWGTKYETMKQMWEARVRNEVAFGGKGWEGEQEKLGTFVAWDFLVDVNGVEDGLEAGLGNRWFGLGGEEPGMTENGVEGEIEWRFEEGDKLILGDGDRYDYLYSDHLPEDAPLVSEMATAKPPGASHMWDKYQHVVSLKTLLQRDEKLILFGTLFGSSRISIRERTSTAHGSGYFGGKLIFKQKRLDEISIRMAGFLNELAKESTDGKYDFYVGALARVGDGVFASKVEEHMDRLLKRVVKGVMDLDSGLDTSTEDVYKVVGLLKKLGTERQQELLAAEADRIKNGGGLSKRGLFEAKEEESDEYGMLKSWEEFEGEPEEDDGEEKYHWGHSGDLKKRFIHRRKRQFDDLVDGQLIEAEPNKDTVFNNLEITPVIDASIPSAEEDGRSLKCGSPLHTDPSLKKFNIPLYLATDARSPREDPNLSFFFTTFPCLFIYDDFAKFSELKLDEIAGWTNVQDGGSKLGGFLITILEAMGAARGRIVFGTNGSTFGSYAESILHPAYMRAEKEKLESQ
ncbi:hypothetical protein BT69DRAFT_1351807 [Atractiella rhizophila]|nr:hypothetical protein BT69DRAFT_1351807 [Atractiella rhizophila]